VNYPEPSIQVQVDISNPGQFFACCGLLELADRLWPGSEGYFNQQTFNINNTGNLAELIKTVVNTTISQIDPEDETASPIYFGKPFKLRLDWWKDEITGGTRLKVWAGSMRSFRIARAMQQAMEKIKDVERLFDYSSVVTDPGQPRKKVEPFYFDSRRGSNSRAIDIGFAPDSLSMSTLAYPAVEFFCLVGLQRCRPFANGSRRIFEYVVWNQPTSIMTAPAAVCNSFSNPNAAIYRFENAFRTDQRKHKAFQPATFIGV